MAVRLNASDPTFEADFRRLVASRQRLGAEIRNRAQSIIEDVRQRGDAALIELTRKFDGFELAAGAIRLNRDRIDQGIAEVPADLCLAMETAAARIEAYHRRQLPQNRLSRSSDGGRLGWRWTAIDSVGIYVPGGAASYPSSVLMNAVPAKVAGVGRITMAAPTPGGEISPPVLLAARLAGVDAIFQIGGAQAIAALAYGTESVARVDKITGPGNAYVTAAKRLVFGDVGIDLVAGPSEVAIIADRTARPEWIAADLLAQAEHDADAQALLMTDSGGFADAVSAAIERQLANLPRRGIAAASLTRHGAVIETGDLGQAAELTNRIAPEHLQLCVSEPEKLLDRIRHAGAVFVGPWSPEAVGDYVAGPNHVLPTMGTARFASGLSVLDFMKRTTVTELSRESFAAIAPAARSLAAAEGLAGHAASLSMRLDALKQAQND